MPSTASPEPGRSAAHPYHCWARHPESHSCGSKGEWDLSLSLPASTPLAPVGPHGVWRMLSAPLEIFEDWGPMSL